MNDRRYVSAIGVAMLPRHLRARVLLDMSIAGNSEHYHPWHTDTHLWYEISTETWEACHSYVPRHHLRRSLLDR